jgi:hypothetical protein
LNMHIVLLKTRSVIANGDRSAKGRGRFSKYV